MRDIDLMFSGVSNISVSPVSEHGGHTVYLETLQDLTGQYNTTQNKLAIELNQNIQTTEYGRVFAYAI